jgi:hypothetical protein
MKIWITLPVVWAALAATTAGAETLSKSVPSGQTTKLDHYTGWNDDCSFLEIAVNVLTKPAHGVVSHRIASGVIPAEAKLGSSGGCAGKPTKVLELYYRSTKGFHGADTLTVEMTNGSQRSTTFTYEISVE